MKKYHTLREAHEALASHIHHPHVKKALNLQGPDPKQWIKKPMWRDGHMVSMCQYYLRTRTGDMAIYDPDYAIRSLLTEYNKEGKITLVVRR